MNRIERRLKNFGKAERDKRIETFISIRGEIKKRLNFGEKVTESVLDQDEEKKNTRENTELSLPRVENELKTSLNVIEQELTPERRLDLSSLISQLNQVEKIKLYLMYAELELRDCVEESKYLQELREKYDLDVKHKSEKYEQEAEALLEEVNSLIDEVDSLLQKVMNQIVSLKTESGSTEETKINRTKKATLQIIDLDERSEELKEFVNKKDYDLPQP